MKRKSQRIKTSRDDTLQQNGNGKSANLPEMETFLEEQCNRGGSHHLFPNNEILKEEKRINKSRMLNNCSGCGIQLLATHNS
jgi:hypothetical protein